MVGPLRGNRWRADMGAVGRFSVAAGSVVGAGSQFLSPSMALMQLSAAILALVTLLELPVISPFPSRSFFIAVSVALSAGLMAINA